MIARHEFRRARLTDEPWATAPSIVVGHKRPAGELRRSAVNSLQGDTHFICPSLFSTHPARLLLRLIRKSCRSPGRSLSGRTCRNPEAALAIVRFQPRRGTSPVQFRPPLLPLSRRPIAPSTTRTFCNPFISYRRIVTAYRSCASASPYARREAYRARLRAQRLSLPRPHQ